MTFTLTLKPELEASLFTQAQASGMTVEEYVLTVVEGAILPANRKTASPEDRARAFEQWSYSHTPTPLLSDEAVSRESFYQDYKS